MGKESEKSILKKKLDKQILESAKKLDELDEDPDNIEKKLDLSQSIIGFQKTEKKLKKKEIK